jgi:DNA-binding transcriptional regulator YhcF (GntR family)
MESALELRVTLESATPVYRQVVNQIRTLCVEGRLLPGERLPSVREIAGRLGVHFNTIADAYRALADEGWLNIEHGRGASVRDRLIPEPLTAELTAQHGNRLRHLVAELRGLGLDPEWIRAEVNSALGGKL